MINQSFKKTQTAKLPVYQKPYPLELIFFVVPHRQSANFSLRKKHKTHKNHPPINQYTSRPRPKRVRSTTYFSCCGPSSPGVKPLRHVKAELVRKGFLIQCVCASPHLLVIQFVLVTCGSGASPRVDRAPRPFAHVQLYATSVPPGTRRSTRTKTQTDAQTYG